MSEITKPVLELNPGIEVEGSMESRVRGSGSDRHEEGVNRMEFEAPETVVHTGEDAPPPAEEAHEPEEAPEEEKPQEEIDNNLLELRKMMGMETKADKESAEKESDVELEKKEEPESEEESEPEEENETPKKRLRRKEPAPSMADMAKLAGQAAAEAIRESDRVSKELPEAVESVQLDDDDQGTYDVFDQMEKSAPDKYKGIKGKFANFVDASKSYQKEWISNNPDEEFDPESDEHADFYAKNEPKYSQSDFKKAEKRVDMADVLGEVEKKYQDRIEELEDRISRKTESQPKAKDSAEGAIKEMVAQVSPDMEKVINEKGLEEAEKSDPLVFDKISGAADTLSTMVYEIEQNQSKHGTFAPNSRNETHKVVSDFVKGREQYVKSLPSEQQVWNGKSFATNSEYNRMSQGDRDRHWTMDSTLLKNELIKTISESVNSEIEQSRAMLERYGVPSASRKAQPKKAGKSKSPNKPVSPESTAQESSSPNLTTGTEVINTAEKELADMMWG
tara:strand:- start:5302 stop:6819 length:1518 start_codon:yes stop_codon:yes gene_type:complete